MKSMMLFSSDKKVARFLEKTFKKIIGHVADLYSSSLEEGDSTPVQTDIVLVSGEFLRPKARALFPKAGLFHPIGSSWGRTLKTAHASQKRGCPGGQQPSEDVRGKPLIHEQTGE